MSPEKERVLKRRHTGTQDDVSQDGKDSKMKRPKSDNFQQVENPQPTNKVLPVHISFPPRAPDAFRIATWNVCGLAASQKKVFVFLDLVFSDSNDLSIRALNIILRLKTQTFLSSQRQRYRLYPFCIDASLT